MSNTDKLEQEAVNHGRDAWQRLRTDQTFEDWLLVGQALEIGRGWARRRANAPSGRGFNEAFSGWLAENGFADIDKGTRSRLADIMEHRPEIEQWRQGLALAERLRKNHPNSIWRGWEADKKKQGLPTTADENKAVSEPRKRKGQASEIDAATDRLNQTIDVVEQRLGPYLAQLFDLSPEHVEASADNLVDIFGEAAVRRLFAVLQRRFASAPDPNHPVDSAFTQSLAQKSKTSADIEAAPASRSPKPSATGIDDLLPQTLPQAAGPAQSAAQVIGKAHEFLNLWAIAS